MANGFLLPMHLHLLPLQDGLQVSPSLFGQMVGLRVGRIATRFDVGLELLYSAANESRGVAIVAHKFRRRRESEVHDVVEHQHLAVAFRAGADADSRS